MRSRIPVDQLIANISESRLDARLAGDVFVSTDLHSHDEDIPRFEPWLGVLASSMLPPVVALYVHARFLTPLIIASVALFVGSMFMLRRQTLRRRLEQQQQPGARA